MVMPDARPRPRVSGALLLELLAVADVNITDAAATALADITVADCWSGSGALDVLLSAREIRLAENGDTLADQARAAAPVELADVRMSEEALR